MKFAIRNGEIIQVNQVKESKRGTSVWCEIDSTKKRVLISCSNLFDSKEEAEKELKKRVSDKAKKEAQIEKEIEQETKMKKEIVERILQNHGVEIPHLTWTWATVEELQQYERDLDKKMTPKVRKGNLRRIK
jgi:hypothetical protein